MPELDDDKTDKLFQVGAGRHDFEYNPAAWEQMEGMLDADDLRRQRLRWLLLAGGLVFLLLLLFGWFQLGNTGLSEQLAPTAEQTGSELPAVPVQGSASAAGLTTDLSDKDVAKAPTPTLATPAASEATGLPQDLPIIPEPTNALAQQIPEQPVRDNTQVNTSPEGQTTLPVDEAEIPQEVVVVTEEEPLRKEQMAVATLPQSMITSLSHERKVAAPELAATTVPTFTSPKPVRGFALGLSAGFASGKTQTGQLSRPRLRLGGRLDYRLNNHFAIGGGAFLTKVDYQSDGKEYKTDENFWAYDILPAKVDADCDILEIPLTLTWFPHGDQRSGVYFGAGLTSYFMLTEKFNFTYDVPDDELIKNWREDNTNQHLLGMGQISIGFQRSAGRRSAVQVASFLQLPLTGIGHGKVNLLTVGASVNYSFDLRKRK